MSLEAILSFLEEHNRPFSINEIHSGVKNGQDMGKASLQKSLNTLVKKGKVVEKSYGKQRVTEIFFRFKQW